MVFLSFLACETMVDDYILYGSAIGCGESREVQPLWLIGEFSALLAMRLGKFPNKLWYFPLANIRVPVSILSFTTSSALVSSVAAPSVLRIGLVSPASLALPIGTRAYRTGSRSSPYTRYSI